MWDKFEEGTSRRSRVIDVKTVLTHLTLMTLTYDLVTPKLSRFLCCPERMYEEGRSGRSEDIDLKSKGYRWTDGRTN